MTSYKEREEALFAEWKEAYRLKDGIDPDTDFACDGLLFRGEYEQICGCWQRCSGNETELWNGAPCRLLILTKDVTRYSEMNEIRIETARKNHTGAHIVASGYAFLRNITLWSYALLNALQGGDIVPYDDTPDWEGLREHYATAPIARVNCKKQIGASSIKNAELAAHIERYAAFLVRQVKMYDADVILCCGGRGIIKDFVKKYYLPDLERFSSHGWVYHSPSTRKVVIDSYHPTYAKSFEKMEECYSCMMSEVKAFLLQYPEYLSPSR